MKKIILASMIFTTFSAFAGSEAVCLKFSFGSGKNDCIKLFNEGIVEDAVAHVCVKQAFDSDKLDCLKAALNKSYTQAGIEVCASNSFGSDVSKCFKNSGRPIVSYDNSSDRVLSMVKTLAHQARRDLENGDLRRALNSINNIIRLVSTY